MAQQLRGEHAELQRILEEKGREVLLLAEERQGAGQQVEEVKRRAVMTGGRLLIVSCMKCVCAPQLSFQHASVCGELKEVQARLGQVMEEAKSRGLEQQETQSENKRLQEELEGLQKHGEQLEADLQELRY